MKTFSEIIDGLGGSASAAKVLGISQQGAWRMWKQNTIHPKYWAKVTKALPQVSLTALAEIAAKPKKGNVK